MSNLLFLCTGNYYRSRFAEMLFNALAPEAALPWTAFSRGLALERGVNNVGPISTYVVQALEARGIPLPDKPRFPLPLDAQDLIAATRVIALKEAEHRVLVEERFPHWAHQVEYWHVHDLDLASVSDALSAIEQEVERLIVRLSAPTHGS